MSKNSFYVSLAISLIGILIGLFFYIIPADKVVALIFVLIGVLAIIVGIKVLLLPEEYNNSKNHKLIAGILFIVIGTLLIVVRADYIAFITGGLIIAYSVYNIIKSNNKKVTFKLELKNLIFGAVLVLFGFSTIINIIFYILGGIIILASLYYLIYNIIILIKAKRKAKKDERDNGIIDL